MRSLSKSKMLAYRQCPKRLWLEIHRPELKDDSGAETAYRIGNEVGAVARLIYNEKGNGVFLDLDELGYDEVFAQSEVLLREGRGPVFEAGLRMPGALAFADVMVPDDSGGQVRWRMIEVKSASGVKDYYRDDIAIQAYVAGGAGIPLSSVAIAHVDSSFVYEGEGDYRGLLREVDFTEETGRRRAEVASWLNGAQEVAAGESEPEIPMGEHCAMPFVCPFTGHCRGVEEAVEVEYPLSSLPNFTGRRRAAVEALGIRDLRDVPDEFLTAMQLRVRDVTRSGRAWLDVDGANADLGKFTFPARFLDFESVMFAVPIWKGRKPYEQIPFQFSLHKFEEDGTLTHKPFLDLSGKDPAARLAKALLAEVGSSGTIFVYNATFEKAVIHSLAARFPEHRSALLALVERLIDLLPIARARFYDPAQHGRWGLKAILPAISPELSYEQLNGVADGAMAVEAYKEAIHPATTPERKAALEDELLAYCHHDTLGLVRLWKRFR